MARRKRTSRKTSRRRTRRVSGIGKLNTGAIISSVGGVLVGTAVAGILTKKLLASQSEMIQAIVPVALGVATPMFVKSEFGKFAGAGMISVGAVKLLAKYGLAGIGEDTMDIPVRIAGDDLSVIAGDDDFAMAGDDDFAMAGDDNLSVLAGFEDDL
jgi:hypothetical protein